MNQEEKAKEHQTHIEHAADHMATIIYMLLQEKAQAQRRKYKKKPPDKLH